MTVTRDDAPKNPELAAIASLRFEVPLTDSAATIRGASGGTADLGEAEPDVPIADEVVTLREGETFRVGRARNNDLVLQNNAVSRFHAVFSASRSGLVLSDLSSLNGTFLNGRKISTPANVVTGDEVRVGHVKITVDLHMGEVDQESGSHMQTQSAAMRAVLVTVLVADIAGFTSMSQSVPAKEVADMLDVWFGETTEIVERHGGEIDKYIGDCVMALWRHDVDAVEEGGINAVQAARDILLVTEQLAQSKWQHQAGHPWRCRVALNTGEALIGSIGSKGARDFTVLGDTVNVAFRLEGVAAVKGWTLALSRSTAELVEKHFPLQLMGPSIIEGRKDTIDVFTLTEE
ncbi:MAG: adenylate/guanylate cyclase domain-containing protein [Bdellovibrionales bacterium]|nr:adenylate/guanylate cyclase domain-containing protein [Bdellovibrionales bacterium]